MRQCPFCGTDESQTSELFCHRCHNQIRAELSGEIYSFPNIPGYNNLVKVYSLIFADVPQFSSAKQIILQHLKKLDNFEGIIQSDKKIIAQKAVDWATKLCDWQVSFDASGKPINLSNAESPEIYKDIEETADGDLGYGINAAIEQIRVSIGKDGFAVRALNLCKGCTITIADTPKIESDSVIAIEEHAKELKSDAPMIFISAPSYYSQSGDKSVEYAVGKALKYQLDSKGIKAFWWENFNKDTNILGRPIDKQIRDLRIAPKIAFGLAFSSIFIGLAFEEENYVGNKNCKYETQHFLDFQYSNKAEEYVSFLSAPSDFKDAQRISKLLSEKLPKDRTTRLLTLSKQFNDYPEELKKLFPKDFNGDDAGNVDCSSCKTVDAYVKKALEVIFNILQKKYYKIVYKPLKDKNGFDSDEEFKNWFCMLTGDVGAFHEIINAPTNYNCSYAVLDEFGADVHDKIEFFVERTNYWDDNEGKAKRIIRLNMVVRETNNAYMSSRQLARAANENDQAIAESCGFLFAGDTNQYQQCEVNYQDREAAIKPIVFRFSDYTKNGGKYCIVKDINRLNSGIIGTIRFQSKSGAIKVYNFAVTLALQVVKIPEKAKHKEGRLYDKVKRKIHCPYCAEPLPRFTTKIKRLKSKVGISCLGEECDKNKFGIRKGQILCSQNVSSEYAFALPEGYEEGKSAFITMMGLHDAGKSVFISKLFEVEKSKIDFANSDSKEYKKDEIVVESVQLSDNYIKYALSPYVESVSCYFPRAIEGNNDIFTEQLWRKQYLIKESGNNTVGIFTNYCSIPYANFVLKTYGDADTCATLHYAPLMLKLKTHDGLENYFSFYDLPGEEIENVAENVNIQIPKIRETVEQLASEAEQLAGEEKVKKEKQVVSLRNILKNLMLLQNSNGIILLVNAGANVNDEKEGVEPICKILTKFLEHKDAETDNDENDKKGKKQKRVKNVALAVVLCQFDRIEHEFDYDSIVRTLAPLEDADFYKGSEIEEYINACSLEVKDYLKQGGYSRLVGIIDNFAYHKYFAVSAIGHQNSIKKENGEQRATTRFISNPRGIDNVLIWLAYQMGMID